MSRTAVKITLDATEQELLRKIHNKRSVAEFMKRRIQAVLVAATDQQNKDIAAEIGLEVHFLGTWRNRWAEHHQKWNQTEKSLRPEMSERLVLLWLSDKKGRGRKEGFTPEQRTKIAALSLESPEQSGLPVTHWTSELLAKEAIRRGIVETISESTVARILKKRLDAPPRPVLAQRQDRRLGAVRTRGGKSLPNLSRGGRK